MPVEMLVRSVKGREAGQMGREEQKERGAERGDEEREKAKLGHVH